MRTLLFTAGALLAGCAAPDQPAQGAATSLPPAHERLHTNRDGKQLLSLPKEEDAFGFVVFGDRTGGPKEGIAVLAQAVADANLIDPDLVFTVGDLVNGYNGRQEWLEQAAEFKATMAGLRMPWFPVAGNHDIYWRGEGKPKGEHEGDYEACFGPLWYAVEHKNCLFVALYSDEGDPDTGRKNFADANCQRFSDAQFAWLADTLAAHRDKRHVFVFLHHPRWLSSIYPGADWERVHRLLADSGNVTAVFGGHIHRMRYDGVRDGIQYFTIAAVGAYLDLDLPKAGFLHEYHVVTVRPEGIQLAAVPVGAVLDPKQISGQLSEDVAIVHQRLRPAVQRPLELAADGAADGTLALDLHNPARHAVEVTVQPLAEGGYAFLLDHAHARIEAGATATVELPVRRAAGLPLPMPQVALDVDLLGEGVRITLPQVRVAVELPPPAAFPAAAPGGALQLLGEQGDCAAIPSERLRLPDGPFTVEAFVRSDDWQGRRPIVAKTQSSEFGLFANDGKPSFTVHLDGRYVTAAAKGAGLPGGAWIHLAGVFDGSALRLYVDGALAAEQAASGTRTKNALPLLVGADPDGKGAATDSLRGFVDGVRISKTARYHGAGFTVPRRHAVDADTALLLRLDGALLSWTEDAAGQAHAELRGRARCEAGAGVDG